MNKLNKQPRTADEGWSSCLGVGRGANNPSPKKQMLRITHKGRCFLWRQNNPEVNYSPTRISGGVFLKEVSRSRKRNRDIPLGTWNVRSLYRAGALMAAARELDRYKLDLVVVQEVRWEKEGTVKVGDYSFFYGKGNENHQLVTGFFVHHRIESAVRVEFVSDRLSYIVLRGCWCNIIVLNVHAPSEDNSDDSKDSFSRNWSRFLIIFLGII